jgi:hypothetical protein
MDQPGDRRLIAETETKMRAQGLAPYFAQSQLEQLHCPKIGANRDAAFAYGGIVKDGGATTNCSRARSGASFAGRIATTQPESQSLSALSTASPEITPVPPFAQQTKLVDAGAHSRRLVANDLEMSCNDDPPPNSRHLGVGYALFSDLQISMIFR